MNGQLWPTFGRFQAMQSRCAVLRRGTGMVARFLQLVVALTLDEIPATRDRTLVLCPTDHRSRKLCDEQNVSIETTGEQIVRRPRLSTSKSRPPFVNIFPSFFRWEEKYKSTSQEAGGYSQRRDRFVKSSAPGFPL